MARVSDRWEKILMVKNFFSDWHYKTFSDVMVTWKCSASSLTVVILVDYSFDRSVSNWKSLKNVGNVKISRDWSQLRVAFPRNPPYLDWLVSHSKRFCYFNNFPFYWPFIDSLIYVVSFIFFLVKSLRRCCATQNYSTNRKDSVVFTVNN